MHEDAEECSSEQGNLTPRAVLSCNNDNSVCIMEYRAVQYLLSPPSSEFSSRLAIRLFCVFFGQVSPTPFRLPVPRQPLLGG